MENEDFQHEVLDLPQPGAGNSLEEVTTFYQDVNRKLDNLAHETQKVYENQDNPWTNRIYAARPKDTEKEHIIGIIGVTGGGKSSIMNCLLNVKKLVPTSSMQACTCTIIEIAYNRSEIHEYTAFVEYVSSESWRAEVSTFLRCFAGLPNEDFEDDACEAAVALAKMKAVYPDLDKDLFAQYTVDELMEWPGLQALGTRLDFSAETGHALYEKIHQYVESSEKLPTLDGSGDTTVQHEMEHWPLVQRVRIFTKAPILRTGCVLVDLPGTFDVNAARAAIAKEYLARCASIWIVVPLVRAVDDKVARTLLSESLRNQLRRDGTLERVVLVCSKADQGLLNEVKGKFKSNATLQAKLRELAEHGKHLKEKAKAASNKIDKVKASVQEISSKISHLELELDAYKQLLQMAKDGQVVHPPIIRESKRSVTDDGSVSRKRLRLDKRPLSTLIGIHLGHGDDVSATGDATIDTVQGTPMNNVRQDRTRPHIGVTELQSMINNTEESLHKLCGDLKLQKASLHEEQRRLEAIKELSALRDNREWYEYYEARNTYVRERLQADFRSGIRELERADLEVKDEFDLTADGVNTVERQMDLPVFCVASQGFQKLCGRLEEETVCGKFTDIDQTGIPDLMRYCITIGEKHIIARRANHITLIKQLLTSFKFWLSQKNGGNDNSTPVSPLGTPNIELFTERLIKDIKHTFEDSVTKIDMETNHVNKGLRKAAFAGEQQALDIVRSWREGPTELHQSTYRAVLRKGGRHNGHDWIEELLAPMMTVVDVYWNRAFHRVIPTALEDAKEKCFGLIRNFLTSLEQNDQFIYVPQRARTMFKDQFERLKAAVETVLDATGFAISQLQMQANRLFDANATSTLVPFFRDLLASDRGRNVIQRYQQRIQTHVKTHAHFMFTTAVLQVTMMLRHSREEYRQPMFRSLQECSDGLRQDCQNLFATQTSSRSAISRSRKDDISKVIEEIEAFLNREAHITGQETRTTSNESARYELAVPKSVLRGSTIKTEYPPPS